MRTVVSDEVSVAYGQFYVESDQHVEELSECFGGQRNGLCGGAVPGALFLVTGLHTGWVGLTVTVHDTPPPVDATWEEIVEVSFRPAGEASVIGWGGDWSYPLALADTDYRVRYCARRMDEGRRADTRSWDEPELDGYLLQFWPAPPRPDRIVEQTSDIAAYWHDFARKQPPPPTPEQRAEARRRAEREREQRIARARLEAETREWGGRLPSERLRQVHGPARLLARLNRPLVDALGEADPATQRAIARWCVRRAYAETRLTDVDWIAPALTALDHDRPLPPPFDDPRRAWQCLLGDETVPQTLVTSPDGGNDTCLQQAMAFPTIFSVGEDDPLRAACDTLWGAVITFGHGHHDALFTELAQTFPGLGPADCTTNTSVPPA